MLAVPPHRHCRICGTPTPPEDPYCSPACQEKHNAQVRQQRLMTLLFVALTLFVIFALTFRGL